ncbi:MAG TPA: signal recognition particle-docking protein FtsY [Thermoanaerobaculia bacterium]|nr:signal recognition particle-docking protein FtsY [Thermoanaerobaculia bacterium]
MAEERAPSGEYLDLAAEVKLEAPAEAPRAGFLRKLNRALFMTHTEIIERISAAAQGKRVLDEATLEQVEEALIAADLGVETALELVERLRKGVRRDEPADVTMLRGKLVEEMSRLLAEAAPPPAASGRPTVTLVVGINGVGKTTSIAKLARRLDRQGERVLIAAADTFRAAAIEQLVVWGERLGVEVVRSRLGADPAAVVYDALQAARARGATQLLVDTAGRLHTKDHLMAELAKVRRVIEREGAGWERRTLLVLDATTGQNALAQARTFTQVAQVDGVLLAKLDGTAKGGMAVAVARELKLPVLYLGVGESADDLVDFRPREFAAALLG